MPSNLDNLFAAYNSEFTESDHIRAAKAKINEIDVSCDDLQDISDISTNRDPRIFDPRIFDNSGNIITDATFGKMIYEYELENKVCLYGVEKYFSVEYYSADRTTDTSSITAHKISDNVYIVTNQKTGEQTVVNPDNIDYYDIDALHNNILMKTIESVVATSDIEAIEFAKNRLRSSNEFSDAILVEGCTFRVSKRTYDKFANLFNTIDDIEIDLFEDDD